MQVDSDSSSDEEALSNMQGKSGSSSNEDTSPAATNTESKVASTQRQSTFPEMQGGSRGSIEEDSSSQGRNRDEEGKRRPFQEMAKALIKILTLKGEAFEFKSDKLLKTLKDFPKNFDVERIKEHLSKDSDFFPEHDPGNHFKCQKGAITADFFVRTFKKFEGNGDEAMELFTKAPRYLKDAMHKALQDFEQQGAINEEQRQKWIDGVITEVQRLQPEPKRERRPGDKRVADSKHSGAQGPRAGHDGCSSVAKGSRDSDSHQADFPNASSKGKRVDDSQRIDIELAEAAKRQRVGDGGDRIQPVNTAGNAARADGGSSSKPESVIGSSSMHDEHARQGHGRAAGDSHGSGQNTGRKAKFLEQPIVREFDVEEGSLKKKTPGLNKSGKRMISDGETTLPTKSLPKGNMRAKLSKESRIKKATELVISMVAMSERVKKTQPEFDLLLRQIVKQRSKNDKEEMQEQTKNLLLRKEVKKMKRNLATLKAKTMEKEMELKSSDKKLIDQKRLGCQLNRLEKHSRAFSSMADIVEGTFENDVKEDGFSTVNMLKNMLSESSIFDAQHHDDATSAGKGSMSSKPSQHSAQSVHESPMKDATYSSSVPDQGSSSDCDNENEGESDSD
jgi:hypothetical protein